MNAGSVISILCVILSAGFLIYILFGKSTLCRCTFRKFIIAAASVYLSGTVFICLVMLIAQKLPLEFTIIAESFILFVFLMTMFTLIKLGNNMDEIREELLKKGEADESGDEE